MNIVFLDTWTESEAGWGYRPDGVSLHKTELDYEFYINAYWKGMPVVIPHEYSRPDDNLKPVEVSDELYVKLLESEHGFMLTNNEYRVEKNNGNIIRI